MKKPFYLLLTSLFLSNTLFARHNVPLLVADSLTSTAVSAASANKKGFFSSFVVSGDVQTDMLLAENDFVIGALKGERPFKSNSYVRLAAQNDYLSSGIRFEYMKNPLPGYEANFAGYGISNVFLRGKYRFADITLGDFYDQFGNGLIFRTYEERNLGIDNALRGARLIVKPMGGLTIKALGGAQRYYFKPRNNRVFGSDVEMNLDEWLTALSKHDWHISLGGSFVTKNEPDEIIMISEAARLNLPEYVPAAGGRLNIQKSGFVVFAEYAEKWNDPSFDNGYIYKNGNAALFSASYSQRGLSLLAQAKRNENMAYRSTRSRSGISSFINHLPPFSMTHSYTLAAKYPYATQRLGEWAFQTEGRYNFKRKTALGGHYGTDIRASFSYIRSLYDDSKNIQNTKGADGYQPRFFEMGKEVYYRDFNVDISKKVTSSFSFTAMYMNLLYNQKVVEGHGNNGDIVHANIFIYDGKYKINSNTSVRTELQYLHTRQDEGDWMHGMIECSLFSKLMLSFSDTYNSGATKTHYPMLTASYSHKSHRIQFGYGRTREGISCAGGVCRLVPASKGLNISYNYNF